MLHNNQTSQLLTLWFTNVTVLTVIELYTNLGNDTIFNVHETLKISFIANMKYKKVAPKLSRHDMMT